MACTGLPRKVVILRVAVALCSGSDVCCSVAGGSDTPASSKKVGAKSMTVVKDRLKEPGIKEEEKVLEGGFTTQGTRMPPCEGKHLNNLDGAVDAWAQRGPSLMVFISTAWFVACQKASKETYQVNEFQAPMFS